MISYIKGEIKVLDAEENRFSVIDKSGVGWDVNLVKIYEDGETVDLYIKTIVRESEISLWGFEDSKSLKLFELLLSVSGVGPKTAFLILKQYSVEEVVIALLVGDLESIKVTGIGIKTMQKIKLLLSEKIKEKFKNVDTVSRQFAKDNQVLNSKIDSDIIKEAEAALYSLGYSRVDINNAIQSIKNVQDVSSTEELLKLLLTKV